jgi:pimeloyl-ACP methyl ester carboxylesterase
MPDLQVWRRDDPFCNELVIAFRGVNLLDPGDWSYLRWLFPRSDPYQQVQARIETIAAISGCRRPGTRMVTVGHSLGGGLAEATAYTDGRIRYVYAFNSFPAGGFVGPDPTVQARTKIGLGIDNVYEAGEIADIPRFLLKGPGTACNPRVRTVQFNLIPIGLPIEKHKINTLTMNMLELLRPGTSPRSALGYAAAARCSETAQMQ